jgi:hypothetical protein
MKGVDLEIQRWIKEQWAVDPKQKKIFLIEETEVLGDKLIIYSGLYSNSSEFLDTLDETSSIEKIRELIRNHFFETN